MIELGEIHPHNIVHQYVGGQCGLMSNLCVAAQDTIFMAHHAQMDRLWETWNKLGGLNDDGEEFLNQRFEFFDEKGRRVSPSVRDFLNITQLGYKYENY